MLPQKNKLKHMKIRTRLTLLFTVITATVLFIFASIIYVSTQENREKEFYTLLKKEAITKANLFFNASVDVQTLQDIYKNNRQILNEVEVAIFNKNFELLYHDAVDIDFVKESKSMIDEILEMEELNFYQNEWQVTGLKFNFQNEDYIITAAAYDEYGFNKLQNLLQTLIFTFTIAVVFIYILGHFFSKKVLNPIKLMTNNVQKISATHLDLRIDNNQSKDEISELANTFNEMLNRLENSFDAQKHFVSNISHELRTPLSAMITELELSANKTQSIDTYKIVIKNALNDAQKLVRLSNALLNLAKASYDLHEISFKKVRVDEILLDARKETQNSNQDFKIDIHFENDFDNENQVTIEGNEYLLKVAFSNLFENGCKFSNEQYCKVKVISSSTFIEKKQAYPDLIILEFEDNGIGISEEDLQNIFIPFFRGNNQHFAEGHGIGLSLTKKIIQLHHGKIQINSQQHKGTSIRIELPICD
jgi:two-component system sensor histidine kinase ArlS